MTSAVSPKTKLELAWGVGWGWEGLYFTSGSHDLEISKKRLGHALEHQKKKMSNLRMVVIQFGSTIHFMGARNPSSLVLHALEHQETNTQPSCSKKTGPMFLRA